MKKFKNRPEDWGDFVDVKVNAPQVLSKEVRKIKLPKEVFMSSICDGWQPLEAKYRLSRECLKILLEAGFNVSILTKSSLILRDFDLLETAHKTASLGMTITTMNQGLQKVLEPYAAEPLERINTLKIARDKGIKTWVFLGPLIPQFSDSAANLEAIFAALKGLNLEEIYVDRLNPRWGVLDSLRRGLSRKDYPNFRLLLYQCHNPAKYQLYSQGLKEKTREFAHQFGLSNKLTFCF
jgi:DNA repair photolyase